MSIKSIFANHKYKSVILYFSQPLQRNIGDVSDNKISRLFYIVISLFLFSFFLTLLVSLCFFNNSTFTLNTIGQLLMALTFFVILFVFYKTFSALRTLCIHSKLPFNSALLIAFLSLFIIQLHLVTNISTSIGWDVGVIFNTAVAESPLYSYYIGSFPNNLLLFFVIKFLIYVFRLIGLTDYWLGLSVVNVMLVDIALFASIITIKKFERGYENMLIFFFIISSFLIGLSPWVIVPYSDTFSMPVVSLFVLFCILAAQAKNKSKQLFFVVIAGVLFAIGWLLKSTIIAVVPALLIVLFLYLLQIRKDIIWHRIIAVLLVGIVSVVSSFGAFNLYVRNQKLITYDETMRTPMSYTIATGIVIVNFDNQPEVQLERTTGYGCWNYDVANLNHGTTQEKNDRFYPFIKEKLQEHGVLGYMKFLFNKARWITSEGNFFWLSEGGPADFSNPHGNFLRDLFYNNGKYYTFYIHAVNGLWIVVFFGLVLGMFFPLFKRFREEINGFNYGLFIRLSAFFIIFLLLFTEGRSRYLLSFLPLFCIVSASGYSQFIRIIRAINLTESEKEKNV